MIYLDNAATSWPKPESVYSAVTKAMREASGNPGRSGHKLSLAAHRTIEEARLLAAQLFNLSNPETIVFTLNATDSLNLALKGCLEPGDHVITSSMEHNSVARPLEELQARGIEVTKVETSPVDGINMETLKAAIKSNTKLVAITHVSNVTGTVNPIAEIGVLCRERKLRLLIDAAQSAGTIPIDVNKCNIDLLAFPGHKGLLAPQGTGGLYIRDGLSLKTIREGGTGSRSELLTQPPTGPERYESGTPNTPGIAGLAAGIRYILEAGVETIQHREAQLASRLITGLQRIPGLTIHGPPAGPTRSGVVSVTFADMDVVEAALILDNAFNISVRSGLHCAPDAHNTLGTLASGGTLRISIGCFNSEQDIDKCIEAINSLAAEGGLKEVLS
ncbi:MAG: aminotransferase class V-fold PLP-dependent enzyme [Firmicutes bacterium]|nr:aminotransferase class V-fold PLP-dependent enzyme [Bacillota bacterium]